MCVHVSMCTCMGMLILDVLKKKKKCCFTLGLLIVYGTVPALCCVLSASHSSDLILVFSSLSWLLVLLIPCLNDPTCCHESGVYVDIWE